MVTDEELPAIDIDCGACSKNHPFWACHGPEPEKLVVTRWRCPHCARSRSSKGTITTHMTRCWRNPGARSCKTCALYEYSENEPEVGYIGGEVCHAGIDLDNRDRSEPYPIGCPSWEAIY